MYRQIKGTGMGPSNACHYADVSLRDFDLLVHSDSLVEVHRQQRPALLERFRDDIFLIWLDTIESLHSFFEFVNTWHQDIKFTMTTPTSDIIEFLDMYVYYKDGILHTKPYSKPCDNHQYLTPSSCHPTHTILNIPYCIAYRLFKICSEHNEYIKSKEEYTGYLSSRGFSADSISNAFSKVEQLDRSKMILLKESDEPSSICESARNFPLVIDFNPDLPPMGNFIHKHKHILDLDKSTSNIIKPSNVFVSYRGNKTIKEILSPSKLKPIEEEPSCSTTIPDLCGSFPCSENCKLCRMHLDSPPNITSFHTTKIFNFKHKLSCKDPWVIYKADDMICKRSYVGSTQVGLFSRWPNHKSHIFNDKSTCGLTKHFHCDKISHDFVRKSDIKIFDSVLSDQLRVTLIDQLPLEDRSTPKLKDLEAFWQSQLRTFTEYGGLNDRDSRMEKAKKSYLSPL